MNRLVEMGMVVKVMVTVVVVMRSEAVTMRLAAV